MNKILIIIFTIMCLTSCEKQYTDTSDSYKLPDDLKNCKVYELQSGGMGRTITVVHCPHAETITSYSESCGKSCTRSVDTTVASD